MTIAYIILAALALGILVFFHELGHYLAARAMKMEVEVFSIGFGRPLFHWMHKGVKWQLGWLPFGGYVKIGGMELTKKDKVDPYEVKNGFFSKAPWKRIIVVLAGPFANLLLALLFFTAVWAMGGREKPFAEQTQIVGWVEPQSELYRLGLRPGDLLTCVNGDRYSGPKDLLYLGISGKKTMELEGKHIDWLHNSSKGFHYQINAYETDGGFQELLSTGVTTGARFLIYDRINQAENKLPEGSPMADSGIQYGDRIVWADGELIFSMDQVSSLLNDERALLTIEREGKRSMVRQPRVLAGDLLLDNSFQNELIDWAYEAKVEGKCRDKFKERLKGKWQCYHILPYQLSSRNVVEGEMDFIDEEGKKEAFPLGELEERLKIGDKIIAVDGHEVSSHADLLRLLQGKHILMVVQRGEAFPKRLSWKEEDRFFLTAWDPQKIERVALNLQSEEGAVVLQPIQPKRLEEFSFSDETKSRLDKEYALQKERIAKMKNEKKRAASEKQLEESYHRYLLGVQLQDLYVNYNPTPLALFKTVFYEVWQTLKALVSGSLSPKGLSGPVGIVQVLHHGWTVGIAEALFWIGAISLNLGFLNLLPIPILDGGYICLSLYEMITKRRVKPKTMERLIVPFVVLLVGLIVFLTFQDVTRLFR